MRCYDYDIMGPPDLIGRIEIGADSILGMVTVKGTSVVVRRAPTHTSTALTWLELEPGKENTGNSAVSPALSFNTASAGGLTEIIRNPFDSLGEIALAVTTTLPLPVSISEYNKWAAKDKADIDLGAQAAAEVGIRVRLGFRNST